MMGDKPPALCLLLTVTTLKVKSESEAAQSCPTLCDPMDCSLSGSSVHGIFQAKNSGKSHHFFLQEIFPTQGLNPGLPHYNVADALPSGLYLQVYALPSEPPGKSCPRLNLHRWFHADNQSMVSTHSFLIWGFCFGLLLVFSIHLGGLPWCLRLQRTCLQYRRPGFDPWVEKILWRREWLPTSVFLPGEFHGQRRLVGYSQWVTESDMMSD